MAGAHGPQREPRAATPAATTLGRTRRLLARVAACALRLLGATWRVEFEGPPFREGAANLVALWHRDMLIATYLFRDRGYGAAVSRSRDGELVARALVHLGYGPLSRGSSSRAGPAALRESVALLERGHTVALLCDGPRGPARRAKRGVPAIARLARVPIRPLSVSASPCIRFHSWDRTLLPLPFARVTCRYGEPWPVPTDDAHADPDALARALDALLDEPTDALDRRHGLRLAPGTGGESASSQ